MEPDEAGTRPRRAVLAGIASLPVWWAGYLLLLYPPSPEEYAVGVLVALLASTCVIVELLVVRLPWPTPGRVLAGLPSLPWQVLRGCLRVLGAGLALRGAPVRGTLHHERAAGIGADTRSSAAERAWRGWAGSLAADRIIAGFPGPDAILVHSLPPEHEPGSQT